MGGTEPSMRLPNAGGEDGSLFLPGWEPGIATSAACGSDVGSVGTGTASGLRLRVDIRESMDDSHDACSE